MFCSCKISTDRCLALSLCNSRTSCFLFTLPFKQLIYRSERLPHFHAWCLKWRWLPQGCAVFGFGWYCSLFRGSNCPQTPICGGVNSVFQANAPSIERFNTWGICLENAIHTPTNWQSDRDSQVLTVNGPNVPQTNPRWWTAAILKIQNIAISPQWNDQFWRNLIQWCVWALQTPSANKILRIRKSKMAATATLENKQLTNFDEIWRVMRVSTLDPCSQ